MFTRWAKALLIFALPFLWGQGSSWKDQQERMVREQLVPRGIRSEAVLDAMRSVPRHRFVPPEDREFACSDRALPIGYEQTISQPYIVAYMTQELDLSTGQSLFELGTGSGYQAAVAAQLVSEVYSVEIVPELAERSSRLVEDLGYDNVHIRAGDGWAGWPEAAPFDRIIVTAAAPELPSQLLEQLASGGRMILPLGGEDEVQELVLVEKSVSGELVTTPLLPVRFVPVTGDH